MEMDDAISYEDVFDHSSWVGEEGAIGTGRDVEMIDATNGGGVVSRSGGGRWGNQGSTEASGSGIRRG